jgi:hypothetical protein
MSIYLNQYFLSISIAQEYRTSLFKSMSFLQGLDPQVVFHQYEGLRCILTTRCCAPNPIPTGVPSDQEWLRRVELTKVNLALSVLYIKCKLVTSALLESIAEETGGDGPISLFLGHLSDTSVRIDEFLPEFAHL